MCNMENFLLKRIDDNCILIINRPLNLNALDIDVLLEFDSILSDLENDTDICCVIITGVDKSFVAGADINYMKTLSSQEAKKFSLLGWNVFNKIERLNKIVVAAVNGYAIGGGCELALACDLRIASEHAIFSQPECGLGIIPGFGGTQRLPRLIGISKAKEMIFMGKKIKAQEALQIGLVNDVVEHEQLMDKSVEVCKSIQCHSKNAIICAKKAINTSYMSFDIGMNIEIELFGKCFDTHEPSECMNAFIEKRKSKTR